MANRLTGSLVHQYSIDVPADPGWAQHDRHYEDSPGATNLRDDAPVGGGWQPASWERGGVVALGGGSYGDGYYDTSNADDHRGTGSHRGDKGRGQYRPAREIPNQDARVGRGLHGAADLKSAGAAGAAHGGLTATGVSAPWANAPVSRRRADGKAVANPGGLDLGSTYVPVADRHRQGLHMNRPFLRFVRANSPVHERTSPNPGSIHTAMYDPITRERRVGPVEPRLRRITRPYGQTDYVDVDQAPGSAALYDPGPIGGEWAR